MNLWPGEHFFPHFLARSVFTWSEVHLYRSDFLQNSYFRGFITASVNIICQIYGFATQLAIVKAERVFNIYNLKVTNTQP